MSTVPMNVIAYFARNNALERSDAEAVFNQLESFLSTATRTRQTPTKALDEAWHAFILHTHEYAAYCSKRFGRFIHHVPHSADSEDFADVFSKCSTCSKCSSNCRSE